MPASRIDRAPYLTLEFASRKTPVGSFEPDRFTTTKTGNILMEEPGELGRFKEEGTQFIGEFECSLVDIGSALGQESFRDIFDASSSALGEVRDLLYGDADGPHLSPELERILSEMTDAEYLVNQNVLYIDRLELHDEYRDRGLGLRALDGLLRAESSSFGLAVLKAFPLQYASSTRPQVRPKEFKRDTPKLMKHYERLGFRGIPRTMFMVLPHSTLWSRRGL